MSIFGDVGKFMKKAAGTAGKPFRAVAHAGASATKGLANLTKKVPLVGPALHATVDMTVAAPFGVADQVLAGKRVDKAALGYLKRQTANVKEVAPYAQTVVATVPGIGNGVSAVIGGGLTLAEGKSIDEAMKNSVLSLVPGGALGKNIANIGLNVMQGKKVTLNDVASLPLPKETQAMVGRGLEITRQLANGAKVDPSMVNNLLKQLPNGGKDIVEFAKKNNINVAAAAANEALKKFSPDVNKALRIGMTVGHAKSLQDKAHGTALNIRDQLVQDGKKIVAGNRDLQELVKTLSNPTGFYVGIGLMSKPGISQFLIRGTRASLGNGDPKKGFDLALAAYIGMATKKAPKGSSPAKAAGYYATIGMSSASQKQKIGMLKTVTKNPSMKAGAIIGAKENMSFWKQLKRYFGFD